MMQETEQQALQNQESMPGGGLAGLLLLLAQSTVLCTVLQAVLLSGGVPERAVFPVLLLPYALLLYGVDALFLRKERTVISLVVLNGCFSAALLAGAILEFGITGLAQAALMTAACVMAAVQAPRLLQKRSNLSAMILWTDFTAAAMILMAADLSVTAGNPVWCVIPAAGFLFALTGLIVIRLTESGNHSVLVPAGLMMGTLLLTLLLVTTAALPAGRGIVAAWSGVRRAGGILWQAIERFMEWLAALIPQDHFEEPASMAETGLPDTSGVTDNSGAAFGQLLLVLLVLAVILAALAALWAFGRSRLAGTRIRVSGRTVKRKRKDRTLRDALRLAMERLHRRVETARWIRQNRGNAAGLYFCLVRSCRRSPLQKRDDESPARFLGRLSESLLTAPAADRELRQVDFQRLIRETDRALFSPGAVPEVLPYAEELRKAVRKRAHTIRKQHQKQQKETPVLQSEEK